MTNDVAIVVLTYNARAHIDACLKAALAQTRPVRVVVADNGSSDGTVAHVREAWPSVELLDFGANLGFAGGYNRALAAVDAEWLALVNADAVLAPDWCERLLAFAGEQPNAVVLGGALLFWRDGAPTDVIQSLGCRFTDAGSAFELGWGMPRAEVPPGWLTPQRTAAIPGAALLIRRRTFWDLGGFDPGYFAYLEDVDLCWRAWLAGGEVWLVPSAVCWHMYGATAGGRVSPLRIRLMQRNRYANMVKLLGSSTLARGLLTSIGYDVYRMLEYVARGRWEGLRALAAGTFEAMGRLPTWWRARRRIQSERRLSDTDLRRAGFLVSALDGMREYRRLSALRSAN